MLGSGTVAPFAVKLMLSRPFALSLDGSPLRKSSVVDDPAAVNTAVNCCQVNVPIVVLLFVKEPSNVPPMPPSRTLTVLVVPKIPPGLLTFPTEKLNVYCVRE